MLKIGYGAQLLTRERARSRSAQSGVGVVDAERSLLQEAIGRITK